MAAECSYHQEEKVSIIVLSFVKQLSYRYLILLNSITLKSNLIVSRIQWLIKCPFCSENVFHPFSGLFISKSCLSPQIKLMINETKNTAANEWRFDEGQAVLDTVRRASWGQNQKRLIRI